MLTPPAAMNSDEAGPVVMAAPLGNAEVFLPPDVSLAQAQFARHGDDLVVVGPDGRQVIISEYFTAPSPPALAGGGGLHLDGTIVAKLSLSNPTHAAAAQGANSQPIGEVDNLSGTVTVVHADGSRARLRAGDTIFPGDVLETGTDGVIGIVFVDNSSFALGSNGRVVLDELIYDPAAGTGYFAITVAHGLLTLVSGEISKLHPKAMTVHTPTADIDVHGTQVGIEIMDGRHLTVVTMEELGGFVGEVAVHNASGAMVLNQASRYTVLTGAGDTPSPIAILSQAELIRIFAQVLSHLPQEQGTENRFSVLAQEDPSDLENFSTAAGGDDVIISGSESAAIRVTLNVDTRDSQDAFVPPQLALPPDGVLDLGGGTFAFTPTPTTDVVPPRAFGAGQYHPGRISGVPW